MNSINVIGRLGKDPEMRDVQGGSVVTNFTIAVNKAKDKPPLWFKVTCWEARAKMAMEYLKKGDQVGVSGNFDLEEWVDKEGAKRLTPCINNAFISLLGSKTEGEQRQPVAAAAKAPYTPPSDECPF